MRGVAYEFRVTWKREGQATKRQTFQTAEGAMRCRERQITAAEEMTWLEHPLPPIEFGPIVTKREVGEWRLHV